MEKELAAKILSREARRRENRRWETALVVLQQYMSERDCNIAVSISMEAAVANAAVRQADALLMALSRSKTKQWCRVCGQEVLR